MGYPCIARDCKKSVKIKSKDREIIQILHDKQKWSINKIARFFQVQSETISTNLNPEYRKKRNQHSNDYKKKQYAEDETIRKKAIEEASKWVRDRRKKDPKYREYSKSINKMYWDKNREKLNQKKRLDYQNDKNKYSIIQKNYRKRNKERYSIMRSLRYYRNKLKKLEKKM